MQEAVGFAGCEIARRVIGISGVEDLRDIKDLQVRVRAEKRAIRVAHEFVCNYGKISTTKNIINIINTNNDSQLTTRVI